MACSFSSKTSVAYREAFGSVFKAFSEKYSKKVFAISELREQHEPFSRGVQDNGLAGIWKVNARLSVFAINPKTGRVVPIATSRITIA